MERGIFTTSRRMSDILLLRTVYMSIFLTSTTFVSTNAKYGTPLSRYTVFLQKCTLEYNPNGNAVFLFWSCRSRFEPAFCRAKRKETGSHLPRRARQAGL